MLCHKAVAQLLRTTAYGGKIFLKVIITANVNKLLKS